MLGLRLQYAQSKIAICSKGKIKYTITRMIFLSKASGLR